MTRFKIGDRVGVPWLGQTCGTCESCMMGHENLCADAVFTGYTHPGGFAQFTTADEQYSDEFLRLAPQIPVQTSVTTYPLSKTNQALSDLRTGKIHGSVVVMPWQ